MNLDNSRQSDNIEIDCLGRRTRWDGGPEGQAALACQAMLREIRAAMTEQIVASDQQSGANWGVLSRDYAEQRAFESMDLRIGGFVGWWEANQRRHLSAGDRREDTYQRRMEGFRRFLEVPPPEFRKPNPNR